MSIVTRYLTPAVLLFAASGCDPSISEADRIREFAADLCSRGVRCGWAKDEASCMAAVTPAGGFSDYLPAGVTFDAAKARECQDLERSTSCSMANEPGQLQMLLSCDWAARGHLPDGATCVGDLACSSGYCHADPCDRQCCAGTCESLRNAGDECTGSGANFSIECPVGTACTCLDGPCTCKTPVADGERCWTRFDCPVGSTCAYGAPGSTSVLEGICQKPLGAGASCTPGLHSYCDWNLWCDPATSRCAPLLATGADCTPDALMCSYWDRCQDSKCAPLPGPGEACFGGECALGASCIAGQCERWVVCE